MKRRVVYHPVAEEELNDATSYYDAERTGLGNALLEDIEDAIAKVIRFPESSPLVNELVRRKSLQRFPYNIMYVVLPGAIRILAISHQKRRPFYWRDRR
jgi:plasmid stabilization system protein ParE